MITFTRTGDRDRRSWMACEIRGSRLSVSDDLDPAMTPKSYARLAVVYGLSFDSLDIGRVRSMGEVKSVPTRTLRKEYEDRHIGPEQM